MKELTLFKQLTENENKGVKVGIFIVVSLIIVLIVLNSIMIARHTHSDNVGNARNARNAGNAGNVSNAGALPTPAAPEEGAVPAATDSSAEPKHAVYDLESSENSENVMKQTAPNMEINQAQLYPVAMADLYNTVP